MLRLHPSSLSWYRCLGGCCVATGIYGMDFYVVLGRRGKRVGRRKHQTGRVGAPHRLTKADAMAWFQATYEGTFRL